MRAYTFDVLICSNILLICSNSFWKFAATILNLQQLYFICCIFILFAARFFNLQQLYFICSIFLICRMSLVGHRKNKTIHQVLQDVLAASTRDASIRSPRLACLESRASRLFRYLSSVSNRAWTRKFWRGALRRFCEISETENQPDLHCF